MVESTEAHPPPRSTASGRGSVALIAGLLLVVAACSGPGGEPSETPGSSSTPTPSTASVPTSSPSPSPTPDPAPRGEELWSAEFWQDRSTSKYEVHHSGDTFLVQGERTVWALSKDGKELWSLEAPEPDRDTDEVTLDVSGDVAIVSFDKPDDDHWPDRRIVRALDVESGDTRWEDGDVSFLTVVSDTAYTTRCNGDQNGRFDNCAIASRDIRTGEPSWTAPTEASARVAPAPVGAHGRDGPQFLLLTVFPNGYEDETVRTLDPVRAQYFGAHLQTRTRVLGATDTLVADAEWDSDSSDGCSDELTGYDLFSGTQRWQQTWKTMPNEDSCHSLLGKVQHGDLISAKDARGRPFLLNLRTGQSHWKWVGEGWVSWLDSRRVLVQSGRLGPLLLVDHRSGKEIWRVPYSDREWPDVTVRGSRVVTFGGAGDTTKRNSTVQVFDLASGKQQYRAPGSFVGGGDDWLATVVKAESMKVTIRVFSQP